MAKLYIFYGSATGNAEQIAKDLSGKKMPSQFDSVVCEPLEKYRKHSEAWSKEPESDTQAKHGVIVVTSTTGNGDAPENASRFVRYVKRKTTVTAMPFKNVAFSVLGLGDTNYDQFCQTARVVDAKMGELGGTRAKSLVCADEATGLEDAVEPWTETVLADITKACFPGDNNSSNLPASAQPKSSSRAPPATTGNGAVPTKPVPTKPVPAKATVKEQQPQSSDNKSTSDSPLFILYGSATGNAEHIAKDLTSTYEMIMQNPDAKLFFKSVVCCELDQYKKKCQSIWEQTPPEGHKHGLLVVCSTTGNGDAPENASRFVRYIKRKTTVNAMPFRHVSFSVLGLGDTNYDQFCNSGKEIDKKLGELGGTRIQPLACADEATGLEDVVEAWKNSIFSKISEACRNSGGGESSASVQKDKKEVVTSKAAVTEKKPEEEEKKMDVVDSAPTEESNKENNENSKIEDSWSKGVKIVRSLLSLDPSAPITNVDHKVLPTLGTNLSSCNFIDDNVNETTAEEDRLRSVSDADRHTVSSASSSAIHYTIKKPYCSSIMKARYLTETSIDAAKKVVDDLKATTTNGGSNSKSEDDDNVDDEIIMRAMKTFDDRFPLEVDNKKGSHPAAERNGKRVLEMTLSLPDDYTLEYAPGDSLGLIVGNTPDAVRFVLSMLKENHNVKPEQKVSIDYSDHPVTVKDAVRNHIDLCSPLKNKRIIHSLSQYATDTEEASALRLLASKTKQGEELFETYIDQQRLSVVDILREFPSTQSIPLTGLLGILPGIPPRYYSVSSSPLDHKRLSLTVAFSVVDYVTPSLTLRNTNIEQGLRRIRGIATRYLEALCAPLVINGNSEVSALSSTTLKIFPKPTNDFHMPSTLSTPLILIGPGTGIAPFMGFLSHRRAMISSMDSTQDASTVVEGTWRGDYDFEENEISVSKSDASGLKLGVDYREKSGSGSVDVFFGCRHQDHDWLFRQEMQEMKQQGIITNLNTAFSRDSKNKDPPSVRYVQDIMLSDGDVRKRLNELLLEKNASLYVCGDGNAMAKDVQSAIQEVLSDKLLDADKAKNFVEKMKQENRWLMDIWTS